MISTSDSRLIFEGNGTTTEFPYHFPIIKASDMVVKLQSSDGTETTLTSDYYVNTYLNAVIYPGYAPGQEPAEDERPAVLAKGEKLIIYRKTPITQETALGDKYPFNLIEKAVDKLTLIDQELYGRSERSLILSESQKGVSTTISVNAGKSFRWSDDGTHLEVTEDPAKVVPVAKGLLSDTQSQASAAASSAAASAASAAASADSAAAAADSEDKAKASEEAAAASSLSASNSAAAASSSEIHAGAFATASTESATAARDSAAAAESSATEAADSAASALSASTVASDSATSAKASETNAKASADSSAASATAAATSAGNAADAATNAANSAQAAAASLAALDEDAIITTISLGIQSNIDAAIATAHHHIQRNKDYNQGDVLTSPNLPPGCVIVVTTAGTTGDSEPDWDSIKSTLGGGNW